MEKIEFNRAYYLKLGKKGKWEDALVDGDKARIGWKEISITDIHSQNWKKIDKEIEKQFSKEGKKSGATQDFNALKNFCEATDKDIFVTFYDSKLYWCFLKNGKIRKDAVSKYRRTKIKWQCTDINGKILSLNQISGRISKTQGFRATLCSIKETDTLYRIINALKNPICEDIVSKKFDLVESIQKAIIELHWKDMEILTDLVFRQTGWKRNSMLGEKMKYMDLELEEPITKELYQVQVKAKAGKNDFDEYCAQFSDLGFKKLFFVVFCPEKSLKNVKAPENVEIIRVC